MKEQLKASVLARCQEVTPKKHDLLEFEDRSGHIRKTMLSNHEMAWEICQKVWNGDGNSGKIVTSISLFESLPFEDALFEWARANNDLGWTEDGRHTFQSIYEHGLINGAKHMYRTIYGKEHPNV